MHNQVRLNGGTNISAALTHAGKMLKKSGSDVAKVIVLITDGRVDGYQARKGQGGSQAPRACQVSGRGRLKHVTGSASALLHPIRALSKVSRVEW